MVVGKAHHVVVNVLLAITGWILLEIVAGIIHVAIIKRAKVCPYVEEAQRAKKGL